MSIEEAYKLLNITINKQHVAGGSFPRLRDIEKKALAPPKNFAESRLRVYINRQKEVPV